MNVNDVLCCIYKPENKKIFEDNTYNNNSTEFIRFYVIKLSGKITFFWFFLLIRYFQLSLLFRLGPS